jgi:molybdopterin adenylyltransferase
MMMTGILRHICISDRKGIAKHEIAAATILPEFGMEGDAHAGAWHRQISLLAHADIEYMRSKGLTLSPGAFGENLVIDRLDTDLLGIGTRLRIGDVVCEITQIGKICHTRCAIYYATGDCIMPRAGLFARVLAGGRLTAGMPVDVVELVGRSAIQATVLTISDRCSAGEATDTAGPAVAELLRHRLDTHIAIRQILPDELDLITAALKDLCDRNLDLIVTVGGTGIAVRDVTPEATRKVLDCELPGLGEAMRAASAQRTQNALLSRAVVGIRRHTLIVNVPGSLNGSTENLDAITGALPHAVRMLRGEVLHPANEVLRRPV